MLWRHGTARCRSPCDYGGFTMQSVKARPVLNVEECDRLSFMPWMFGADFMLAESQVYALAKQWMPEYSSEFWHFIRLPEGGGYMMPDCGRVHLVNSENGFDRIVSADAAGIILTSLAVNRRLAANHDSGNPALTHLYMLRDAQLWNHITLHPECNAIYAALD
ncbi:antirestriction protein [Klebsiella pneumoniae]|nr:antirestriction protein [Klebsiella pneumoniae]